MWCAWIGHSSEKLWPFEFLHSFRYSIPSVSICDAPESDIRVKSYDHLNFSGASVVQLRTSRYIMRLNRTSVWKVFTIWISGELSLFNFERLDMCCAWIGHPSEKLLAFEFFSELPLFIFKRLDMWCTWIGPPCEKFRTFEFLKSSCCSISSVSICDATQLDIRVKNYDHFSFSRISVVQFRASLYSKRLNRTSVWKVMTIWISRELPLCIYERLYRWYAWIGHPSEKLLSFELALSFKIQFRASQ